MEFPGDNNARAMAIWERRLRLMRDVVTSHSGEYICPATLHLVAGEIADTFARMLPPVGGVDLWKAAACFAARVFRESEPGAGWLDEWTTWEYRDELIKLLGDLA